ncbi:hypothetical protein ACMGDM_15180 [Sphingomonas sp. DT-51]|uniref:hypothetical protein n=1 Tax=Sphingomonas sp. DT-51 TaxID=3396165 RepID=UPI003F1E3F46
MLLFLLATSLFAYSFWRSAAATAISYPNPTLIEAVYPESASGDVLRIPASALETTDGNTSVWVIDAHAGTPVVRRNPVSVRRADTRVAYVTGIAAHDRLIATADPSLTSGQAVVVAVQR